jgi:hypothetical protein
MTVPHLFKGVAVVIDNGIGTGEAIDKILASIRASGGHAIELGKLPPPDYDLEHFARVSFFIMDWNLANDENGIPLEAKVRLPEMLDKQMVADNIDFLKRLRKSRHAPVVIFSNEDPDTVIDELSADAELHKSVQESHILVKRKVDVADKVYEILEDWGKATPSVLTLKTWERNYIRAANDLFIDLHNRTPYWPVLLWQTFGADNIPPEVEMNKLLNRLVESRMDLLALELKPFLETVDQERAKNHADYIKSMNGVLEGERFLRASKLKDGIYAPGDIFERVVSEDKRTYWMNIRAECDCLRGSDSMELYLLQLKLVENPEISRQFGLISNEKDTEAVVFAMMDGKTYTVKFKDMDIRELRKMKDMTRVGRLLPPFVTRVQQRYASYLQRPGMPRIPEVFYPAAEEAVKA